MTVPNLLFPVKVRIRPIDKAATRYDHVRREPVNTITRAAEYEIDGQVVWADQNQVQANRPDFSQGAGVVEQHDGYVVLRVVDLEALGKTPVRGDQIVKLADRTIELFVDRISYHAHYEGKFQLLKLQFRERRGETNAQP